ncbi:MAG: DciA family protein [Myxococcota bacterium]
MDDTTTVLLKVLRSHFEASPSLDAAWQSAPSLALMHLSRPGWPAEFLKAEQKRQISTELTKLALQLKHSNHLKILLQFVQQSIALVLQFASTKSKTQLEKQRLMGFIRSEQMEGQTDEAAAARGAARFLQSKRREHRDKVFIDPNEQDRLLEILSLPKSMGAQLPKQDIRGLILKSPLAALLKQASCFSPEIMKRAFGEEWLKHIQPVGFADKTQKTILISVKSSSVAHEMSYRKAEIIRRLHQIKEFEQVSDVRFTVEQPAPRNKFER